MLSQKVIQNVKNASWIRKMFEEGAKLAEKYGKENVYDFSIGNPFAEPPKETIESLEKHIKEPGIHRYMNNAGYPEVRKAIAADVSKNSKHELTENNIVMTVGAAGGLNVILKSILNPGEEVVVFAPYFVEYGFYAENHGGKLVKVSTAETNFQPNIEGLKEAITAKTKAIIINSPNNPSGAVYKAGILEDMAKLIKEKEEELGITIFVISDEPYTKIAYDNVKIPNILDIFERGIMVTSFSKSLGLAGERIGYIATRPDMENIEELMGALIFSNRTLGFVNAPGLFQKVAADSLEASVNVTDYLEKRDYLYENLTRLGFEILKPEGTFYLFPKSPFENDLEFVKKALEYNILLVPGTGFGCPGYFRMSYCVEFDMIERSISAFEKLANELGL